MDIGVDDEGSGETPPRTRRKSPDMVYRNGYSYVTQKTIEGTRYLKCNMRTVSHCTATAKMPLGGSPEDFVEINSEHNHGRSDNVKKKTEFTEILRSLCSTRGGNLKDIYRRTAEKDPSGAAEVPFELVVQSMRVWRKRSASDAHLNPIECDDRRLPKVRDRTKKKNKKPRRASDIIFKDGFAYVFQQIGGNPPVRYVKCRMKRLTNCLATGKVPLDESSDKAAANFVHINAEHNHPPEVDTERRTAFVKILKTMCSDVANKLKSVKKVYEAAVVRYPDGVGVVPFKTVQSSMFKWKKKALMDEI